MTGCKAEGCFGEMTCRGRAPQVYGVACMPHEARGATAISHVVHRCCTCAPVLIRPRDLAGHCGAGGLPDLRCWHWRHHHRRWRIPQVPEPGCQGASEGAALRTSVSSI
jgi:hypothetical protein